MLLTMGCRALRLRNKVVGSNMPLRCLDSQRQSIHSFHLSHEQWRGLELENMKAHHIKLPCCSALVATKRAHLGTPSALEIGGIEPRFSRTQQRSYMNNEYFHCDALIGEFFEHDACHEQGTVVTSSIRISKHWQEALSIGKRQLKAMRLGRRMGRVSTCRQRGLNTSGSGAAVVQACAG
jgi:hypothetical protein